LIVCRDIQVRWGPLIGSISLWSINDNSGNEPPATTLVKVERGAR